MWDRRRARRKQKRRQVIGWILMGVQVFIQLEETRLVEGLRMIHTLQIQQTLFNSDS